MSRLKTIVLVKACVIVILLSSCGSTKNFTSLDLDSQTIHSIDSICLLQLNNEHYPGLAIAVAEKGNKVWSKGYGYSNLEIKLPVDARDDLFRIGSISKTVTACALAHLKERNIVSLDVPISNYYHECPPDKDSITLRQLGGHQAGIRHYAGLEFLSNVHYTTIKEAMEVFIHDTLLFEPGTKYNYSTYGWTLISEVMQDASGTPFTEIIRDEVSRPLKLSDLKPDISDSIHFQRVQFYEFQNGQHSISPHVDLSNKWAGGGFLCSA
jgi:serine beta-lactamase-like protein LACTB